MTPALLPSRPEPPTPDAMARWVAEAVRQLDAEERRLGFRRKEKDDDETAPHADANV